MFRSCCRLATSIFLCIALAATSARSEAPRATRTPEPIPLDQLGAAVAQQYRGDGMKVSVTEGGARLGATFQKLEAEATEAGLIVRSTVEGDDSALQLAASGVGRGHSVQPVAGTGRVAVAGEVVRWSRPGLREEYSVSVDGIRQDFVVTRRPDGDGDLRVELALDGATAEQAAGGARFTMQGSGRVLVYDRLHVEDASGRELMASLQVLDAGRLVVRGGAVRLVRSHRAGARFTE